MSFVLKLLARGVFLSVFLGSTGLLAKTFKTQFIKFEIPPNWSCKQEEIDWVCQPDNLAERSEAIVVVVTKAVNEIDDNLKKYDEILHAPKPMRDLLGNSYKSQIKYVRNRNIKGQEWIDALQLGSEMPGFYTRYLAATKEKVAGLLTYSVAESVYPKYAQVLDQMVDSLEIFFDPKAFAEAMAAGPTSLLGSRGASLKGRFAPSLEGDKNGKKDEGHGLDRNQMVGLAILLAVIGYFIWKRSR